MILFFSAFISFHHFSYAQVDVFVRRRIIYTLETLNEESMGWRLSEMNKNMQMKWTKTMKIFLWFYLYSFYMKINIVNFFEFPAFLFKDFSSFLLQCCGFLSWFIFSKHFLYLLWDILLFIIPICALLAAVIKFYYLLTPFSYSFANQSFVCFRKHICLVDTW